MFSKFGNCFLLFRHKTIKNNNVFKNYRNLRTSTIRCR